MRPAAVYAAFDHDGQVIYLGSAYRPADRWAHHRRHAPWAAYAHHWDVVAWYPNRAAAYLAERRHIRLLRPWANQADNPHTPLHTRLRHLRPRR